ncbi:DUF262 domain-containing protein [Candidatus Thiodubiliella endoseptemdiera]|uniref:DUF262 domain-containing protein n=1 Tax=Candidatus Thiodubiliella endoseptemdiera TaxID=2738886 RepID=UPI0034DE08D4
MGNKLKIKTDDLNLRDLLGNGKKYFVPKFQRDYSWENEQWQDLWEDIAFICDDNNDDEYHYMGYLVLQEKDDNVFIIIDGQQRFTTFSLIVLAAIKRLKEINDNERAALLLETFIGTKDLTYLNTENKLKLNRNNDFHYRKAVEGQPIQSRGAKKTIRLMHDALEFFYGKFCSFSQGENINSLIESVARKTLFTTIFIGDELNAYKVFETLNARGVKLSSADLLKNYLFSIIDVDKNMPDNLIDELDEKWEKIGENISGKNYTDYIFTEWNSRHKRVRKNQLFKSIKSKITTNDIANKYLDELSNNCYLYAALVNPEDEFWKDIDMYHDIRRDLLFLRMFGISQPTSLLFASYLSFKKDFHIILRWVKVLSLRYNVICREHTGEQESLYSDICVLISNGCNINDVKEKLLTLYPNDEKFKLNFSNKTFPTKQSNKKARYLLARLEEFEGETSIDEAVLTIEHILPENSDEDWIKYFDGDWQKFNQRLGNMALIDTHHNMSQEPFDEKKPVLFNSVYKTNKNINDYSEWDESAINSRQNLLAEVACNLWKID